MVTQASAFMLWGEDKRPLTYIFEDKMYYVETVDKGKIIENRDTRILCELRIHADRKKALLKDLELLGINEKFIYP